MSLDQRRYLPDDVLAKADRATMLASLEMRTPYLSRDLAEFSGAIPASVHIGNGGKAILRESNLKITPADGLADAATKVVAAAKAAGGEKPARPAVEI